MANGNQYQLGRMAARYECLLFDVDDTLYPKSSGLSQQCAKNIEGYMVQRLGMEESQASELCRVLYRDYGSSMGGLKAFGYDFDNDDYHSYVHGSLPYENLKPDSALRKLLLGLPIRKVIFSNADKAHVAIVLHKLGIADCFDEIINFESLNPPKRTSRIGFVCKGSSFSEIVNAINGHSVLPRSPIICKPSAVAFEQAFKIANINPHKTLFFDDNVRNIQTAKSLGLHTTLVGTLLRTNGADYAMESIHSIRNTFPELWDANKKHRSSSKCSGRLVIKRLNYILKSTLGDISKTMPKRKLNF